MGTISSISRHGTANTKTSPKATASAAVPARPPISSASGASSDGSREPLTSTSWPARANMRAHPPPIRPAPTIPIRTAANYSTRAYVTVSVPCMPACRCESTGQ